MDEGEMTYCIEEVFEDNNIFFLHLNKVESKIEQNVKKW
jgi:hypothetical protein